MLVDFKDFQIYPNVLQFRSLSSFSLLLSLSLFAIFYFSRLFLWVLCTCSVGLTLIWQLLAIFLIGEVQHLKFSLSVTTRGNTHCAICGIPLMVLLYNTYIKHKQQIILALVFITNTVLCFSSHCNHSNAEAHGSDGVCIHTGLWAVFLFLPQSADELWQ